MAYPVYMVPAGDVLPIFFDTFDGGTGASITMTGLAVTDIEIYKDGSVTQRASDAGYTLLDTDGIDFDGVTGIHGFSINTGDNTDSGFYTTGSWFHVVVSTITVDGQTVSFVAAAFRIMAAEASAGVPAVNATHIGGTSQTGRDIGASVLISSGTGTGQLSVTSGVVASSVSSMGANTLTASALATDAVNEIQSGLATASALATAQADLDTITGTDGVTLATTQANYAPATAAALATAQADLDTITGSDGVTLATTQGNYAPATAAALATAQTDLDTLTGTDGVTLATSQPNYAPYTGTPPTAAAIADQVWEEAIADHSGTGGSTAEQLAAAGAAGDPWSTALPGAYGAGTAGNILGNNLDAPISDVPTAAENRAEMDSNSTQLAAIVADTNELQTDDYPTTLATLATAAELAKVPKSDGTATWNATALGSIQSEATDALNAYDPPTRAELTTDTNSVLTAVGDVPTNSELATALAAADDAVLAAIAALNNLSAAEVNAEVVDALATDTYAEPGQGTPAATASLAAKLNYLFKAWRNRTTQTATQYTLYADDGTTTDQIAAVSDDGTTLDRGEVATGA